MSIPPETLVSVMATVFMVIWACRGLGAIEANSSTISRISKPRREYCATIFQYIARTNSQQGLDITPFALAPGITATKILTVSSKAAAGNGSSNVTTIGVSAPDHTPPANVTATTTVAPVSPLMQFNSINTQSTKWGANGWGIPGGQYGEFECKTCHTPGETANIKRVKETITAPTGTFPGGAVNFKTTTTPNGFGDDSNAHATSTKVCEVCHTYDATQANGVKYHAYNMSAGGADLAHNNNTDCMVCHKHQSAFKASCSVSWRSSDR